MTERPTAELGVRWRRGNYCARIDGTDPKYGLRREFETAVSVVKAGGGWLNFRLDNGYYEVREAFQKRYLRVLDGLAEELPGLELWIAEASEGPAPGEPGAWGSDHCHCGSEVTHYDPQGFPTCDEHAEQTDRFEAAPDVEVV